MEGLARRHSEGDIQLEATQRLQTGENLQRPKGGEYHRLTLRLVIQGHAQEPGTDYGRSYAPVCRIGSIRTLLAIACEHGLPVWQMDVVVAFLQSLIDKDVFVEPTPGHDPRDSKTGEVMVYKLQRSVYGLAQSPVLWYDTIDEVLVVKGSGPHNRTLAFTRTAGESPSSS